MIKHLISVEVKLIAAILLFISIITTLPYEYYIFLRWYIFIVSIYMFFSSIESDFELDSGLGCFILLFSAFTFNPFHLISNTKHEWRIIDGVLLVCILFLFLFNKREIKYFFTAKTGVVLRYIKYVFSCIFIFLGVLLSVFYGVPSLKTHISTIIGGILLILFLLLYGYLIIKEAILKYREEIRNATKDEKSIYRDGK